MDPRELNQLFEQLSPTQEQEDALLDRLLDPDQEGTRPMQKSHKMKLLVVLPAAAVLAACAFTAASALDPRLLSLFQRTPQDTEPLADGVVAVDQSHTYENGWTVDVRQVLADRYSLTVLVEVTAPEGTALDQAEYYLDLASDLLPELEDRTGVGGWRSGSTLLADDDPTDNQLTFLWYRSPTSYLKGGPESFTGRTAVLTPRSIQSDGWGSPQYLEVDLSQEAWTCTVDLPEEDSGTEIPAGQTVQVGEDEMELTRLYLSPISCAFTLQGEGHDSRMWGPVGLSSLMEETFLTLTDGSVLPMSRLVNLTYNQDTGRAEAVFQLERIVDPDRVESVTILDQTVSLEPQS